VAIEMQIPPPRTKGSSLPKNSVRMRSSIGLTQDIILTDKEKIGNVLIIKKLLISVCNSPNEPSLAAYKDKEERRVK
jgi:hypothetical protein